MPRVAETLQCWEQALVLPPSPPAASAVTVPPSSGAAEGLRLSAAAGESVPGTSSASLLSRAWLLGAAKPEVPSYTHAGLLLALGLTGNLDRLTWTDLYR